ASARVIDAVNPLALTRTIKGLGVYYLIILAIIGAYALVLVLLARTDIWEQVKVAFLLFSIYSIFCVLGGALYERRHALGLEPTHTPERQAERKEQERARERHKALDEVHGEARGGNFMAARDSLLRWLRFVDADLLERDVRFIFEQARTWQDEKA